MSDNESLQSEHTQSVKAQRRRESSVHVWLGASERLMRAEIGCIRRYLDTIAESLQHEFERFTECVANEAANMDGKMRNRYEEACAETAIELTLDFPSFARQTTFVAIYSLLEDEMLSIARGLGKHLGITLDPEERKDKGVFAARSYLESPCGIAFPASEHAWQEVQHYNRLRNVIVHCRGCVKGSKREKAINDYVRVNKAICLDDFGHLQISWRFCLDVVDNVETLLETLFKLAWERTL